MRPRDEVKLLLLLVLGGVLVVSIIVFCTAGLRQSPFLYQVY